MPKYGNLCPDPQKMKIFRKLFFHVMQLIITLQTSPHPLSDYNFSSRYEPKRILGSYVIWGHLGPNGLKWGFWALDPLDNAFFVHIHPICCSLLLSVLNRIGNVVLSLQFRSTISYISVESVKKGVDFGQNGGELGPKPPLYPIFFF